MQTLVLQQGITSGYSWPIVDPSGQPADLTGWTARSHVRTLDLHTAELLADLEANVEGSHVVVRWDAAASLAWAWKRGAGDVLLIDPEGVPRLVVWQGLVEVDRVVTHV